MLRRRGYYVEANSVFLDRTTGASRELDIHAIRAQRAGPGRRDYLWTVALIECVNNPEPLVLITKRAVVPSLHHHEIQASGIPLVLPAGKSRADWERFSSFLKAENYHHYCRGRIATQYCSFQKKKQKPYNWMAWHDETHFDVFKKLCHALEYEIDWHHQRWKFDAAEYVNVILYYPILVVQGQLMEARPSSRELRLLEKGQLMLRRSEFFGTKERSFQIDVVQERRLSSLMRTIEQESDRIASALRRRHRQVAAAIHEIVRVSRR